MTLRHFLAPFLVALCLGMVSLPSHAEYKVFIVGVNTHNHTTDTKFFYRVDGHKEMVIPLNIPVGAAGEYACCEATDKSTKAPLWIEVEYKPISRAAYLSGKYTVPPGPSVKRNVAVKGHIPPEPKTLEIHFYPGGRIEAELSDIEAIDPVHATPPAGL
ncbi:hypothetical protein [Ralstonia sp. 1138]|uniref:hypothetical protein n=1 Tax=Ralstonia sp. 1138 TaxID=3156423 RepID=UPI0033919F53